MRLLLQGQQDEITSLPDQYLIFMENANFNIASFVAAAYNTFDAYLIGAGGGGGGGGGGRYDEDHSRGGGAGGGAGGGSLIVLRNRLLVDLAGASPVVIQEGGNGGVPGTVGQAGGNTSFAGATAYGGGPGGPGSNADATWPGYGGGGGGGGGVGEKGSAGQRGTYGRANGGVGAFGGLGGTGAGQNAYAQHGYDGKGYGFYDDPVDNDRFGGGGGGGGGRGININGVMRATAGSYGGKGFCNDPYKNNGGSAQIGHYSNQWFNGFYTAGNAGGGGGGVDLTSLLGFANLDGKAGGESHLSPPRAPGGGGMGGHGGLGIPTTVAEGGQDGAKGCVIVRVYKA